MPVMYYINKRYSIVIDAFCWQGHMPLQWPLPTQHQTDVMSYFIVT